MYVEIIMTVEYIYYSKPSNYKLLYSTKHNVGGMRRARILATWMRTILSKQGLVSYEHVNTILSASWEHLS